MGRIKRMLMVASIATATAAAPLAVSSPAGAAESAPAANEVAAAHACGYNSDEYYRHCGDTHVIIRAENFWGTDYYLCVGPGDTYLGYLSDWRIIYAVYIGYLC
jgi:hypothetical protein